MQNDHPFMLSEDALAEYKRIYQEQFGDKDSDEDIYASAYGLMKLFRLLLEPSTEKATDAKIGVTIQEFTALKYLHHAIYHKGKSPSVRDVCAAIGLRSSRSGQVMIEKLMKKGFIYRDPDGRIQLSEPVHGCDANLWELAVRDKK